MYLNKVMIYGNLTRDPEFKALPSGMNVASFGVATNRTWKDKDGSKKEATEFHNIVVFGKQADTVSQWLKKGAGVFVEGRIQTRSWDDKKSGEKKYRTEIVADRVQFGPKGGSGAPKTPTRDAEADAHAQDGGGTEEIAVDDIPF